MRTVSTNVYQYDELSADAQSRARQWYREASAGDEFYSECIFEDAANMADILGIDLRQTRKTCVDGSHRYDPTIYFSGFWSQGDGACFEGSYKYAKGSVKKIRAETNDAELIRIASALQTLQRKHFYALTARMKQSGHYYHSHCMRVDVSDSRDDYRDIGDAESNVTELMRDFADWIYRMLESEYNDSMSDETVSENIRCNEYEFEENGARA